MARPRWALKHCAVLAGGRPPHVLRTCSMAVAGAPASCSPRLELTGRMLSPLCPQVRPGTVPSLTHPHALCALGSPPFMASNSRQRLLQAIETWSMALAGKIKYMQPLGRVAWQGTHSCLPK